MFLATKIILTSRTLHQPSLQRVQDLARISKLKKNVSGALGQIPGETRRGQVTKIFTGTTLPAPHPEVNSPYLQLKPQTALKGVQAVEDIWRPCERQVKARILTISHRQPGAEAPPDLDFKN